jgi:hypothetical protein
MLVFEFNAVMEHGSIPVPKEYQDKIPGKFQVIVKAEEENATNDDDLTFTAMELDTKGFVFNRDEANER